MDHKHDHLPEVVQTTNYPEVVYHQQGQYQQYPKPEDGTHGNGVPYSAYSTSQPGNQGSPQFYHTGPPIAAPAPEQLLPANKVKRKTTILGCSVLMFTLCAIIALLSVAVIGLAAGTGIEANRANTAEASSSTAQATVATSSTSFAELDDNCSGNPDGVTGTTYDAFSCKSKNLISSRYSFGPFFFFFFLFCCCYCHSYSSDLKMSPPWTHHTWITYINMTIPIQCLATILSLFSATKMPWAPHSWPSLRRISIPVWIPVRPIQDTQRRPLAVTTPPPRAVVLASSLYGRTRPSPSPVVRRVTVI